MWHVALLLVCGIAGVFSTYTDVYQAMLDNLIQPDVVIKAPSELIYVKYPSGRVVNLGNNLKQDEIVDKPSVKFDADPKLYYTLCLTEPDQPSPEYPTGKEFVHWLVVNIPGNDTDEGKTLFKYNGSTTINAKGPNRYVFLVYEQPKFMQFVKSKWDQSPNANRSTFSIFEFAYIYGFQDPKAGNLFLTAPKISKNPENTTSLPPTKKDAPASKKSFSPKIKVKLPKLPALGKNQNTPNENSNSKEANPTENKSQDNHTEEQNDMDDDDME